MWLFSIFPDTWLMHIINIMLIVGVVATFLSYFVINRILRWWPMLAPYMTLAQIISAAILLGSVYAKGSYQSDSVWQARIAEAEAKVAAAEIKSAEATAALEKKSTAKVKVIREKALVVKQYIDREVTKYDTSCVIPLPVVKAHNAAAKNETLK